MTTRIVLALVAALSGALWQAPAPSGDTPAACLQSVRDHVAKRQQESRPLTSEIMTAITADRSAMLKACIAKFSLETTPDKDLAGLADLYVDAGQLELGKAALARAMQVRGLGEADRAKLLVQAIRLGLREPKGDERNARLEKLVDELDAMSNAVLDDKFSAHISMNGYYRGDDIDAGIIKHSTWLIDTGKNCDPALRKKYGPSVVSAYVNMAEAWAGQDMNDKAIALLRRAPEEWTDVPNVASRVEPTLARYLLVGTPGAAITAPRWLNAPSGATSLDMKGAVTLLEFTAHWCGPCKESYPGINRLRERFGPKGFRVVLATQLYGYFQTERNLDAETEIARDRAYFAEHHLDVPIAIGDQVKVSVKDGKVIYTPGPNPNDEAYEVGGIPQIQLIDRQGRIRLIMVGYDDANEPKLAAVIEKLLAEK